jgi:hypothetical protein
LLFLLFAACSNPAGSEPGQSTDVDTAVYNAVNATVNPQGLRSISRSTIIYNTSGMSHYLEAEAPEGKVYAWTTNENIVDQVTAAIENAYPQAKFSPLWAGQAERDGEPATKISFYKYNSDSGMQSFGIITQSGDTVGSPMNMRTFMLEPRSGTVIADAVRTGTKIKEGTNSEGSKFYIVKVEEAAFSGARWNELVTISNGTKSCAFYFSAQEFSSWIDPDNAILINVVSYGYCRILGADKTVTAVEDYENDPGPDAYYAVAACYYDPNEGEE